ncbi:MAG: tetratricopeptide repeat protein [Treponema sp.]|uniref:tetratricopeptide repeat protein n=1 Tax=Treponema sp. TaxID=166 RepID=UPI00298D692C|nr:tetratricopeptide repeat protein [Treponema sp.]MBR5934332.1 tetratricopeptide repeat protein [Treponema sp.]
MAKSTPVSKTARTVSKGKTAGKTAAQTKKTQTAKAASKSKTAPKTRTASSASRTAYKNYDREIERSNQEIKALLTTSAEEAEYYQRIEEENKKKAEKPDFKKIGIIAGAVLAVILLLILLVRGCSGRSAKNDKSRENTIRVAKMYIEKDQLESAKDLLEKLLIENPDDEEVQVLFDEVIQKLKEAGKEGSTVIINNTSPNGQVPYDININTDELTSALDSMSRELNAANEKNAKNQEAINRLLEAQTQNEQEKKAQEAQKKQEEAKRRAEEEELAKQNKKNAEKINKINEMINQANQSLNSGKSSDALKKYNDAVSLLPIEQGEPKFSASKYSEIASNLYDAAERETNPSAKTTLMKEAVNYAQKAIEKDPNNAKAHFILAMNAENEKNDSLAEKELELAAQNDPGNYLYYYYLGRRQQINRKYSQARASYNTSIKLNNKFESSYFNLGLTCKALNLNKEALSAFRSAHTVNPQHAKAYLEEGRLLYRTFDDINGAITAFEKVISLEPDNLNAIKECGSAYAAQGKYVQAEEKFRKAISKLGSMDDPITFYNLSTVLYNQNKVEEAVKYAQKAYDTKNLLKNNKEKAMVVYNFALIKEGTGNKDDAILLYKEVLTLDPSHSKAMTNVGIMYLEMTPPDVDMALGFLTKAYQLDKNSFEISNNLGSAYLEKKDYQNAIDYYLKALSINSKDNKVRTNLAQAQAEAGQFDNAKQTYIEVIQQKPDNYEAYINLSKVCIALKDTVSAQAYLEALKKKKPEYKAAEVQQLLDTVKQ